jgi:mono/diheme cytochrome c family protein
VFNRLRAAIVVVTAVTVAAAGAASAQTPADKGQQVFAAQKCTICHSVAGKGNPKGPLDNVGAKHAADVIRQWVTNAPEMAAKSNATRKPAMKSYANLPNEDVEALVAYLITLKKS